jgi:8-oxo-dGTP pyrophosphatase MutT (NUDIX family)
MSLHYPQEVSAGCIIYRIQNDQLYYLLLKNYKGYWDFPKGHLELQESLFDAAHREVYEEVGLKACFMAGFATGTSYTFARHNCMIRKLAYYFLALYQNEKVVLSPEHTGYKWMTLADIKLKADFANTYELILKAETYIKNMA